MQLGPGQRLDLGDASGRGLGGEKSGKQVVKSSYRRSGVVLIAEVVGQLGEGVVAEVNKFLIIFQTSSGQLFPGDQYYRKYYYEKEQVKKIPYQPIPSYNFHLNEILPQISIYFILNSMLAQKTTNQAKNWKKIVPLEGHMRVT